jgi:GntR family transcriptional regulator
VPDARAAYLVLADELRGLIRSGNTSASGQLPTEMSLADHHGLSRQTVRRAYLELVSEGLVDRIPGRGTFVSERDTSYLRTFSSVEDLMDLSLDTSVQIRHPLRRSVNIAAAARLGLEGDVVHSVEYVRSHRGAAFGWTSVSLPPHIADLLDDYDELSTVGASTALTVIGLLDGLLDDPIAQAEQSISSVAAAAEAVDVLNCEIGAPLLRIDRLFRSERGEALELSVGFFLPDQYTYRTTLRRSTHREPLRRSRRS